MMQQVRLKIITPEKVFWDKDIDIVTVKTTEGYIGLQKNKSPFVAALDVAELHINIKGTKDYYDCAIAGGIVKATKSEISIITDAIEFKGKIDLPRAEKAKRIAEQKIKDNLSESENIRVQLSLKKAINRIEVRKS